MPFLPLRASVAALVLVGSLVGAVAGCDGGSAPVGGPAARTPADGPAAVLRDWDAARAAAWSSGDPGALGDLYLPGARSGHRDVRLLRSYVARGLRVRDLRFQRLAVRVLVRTEALLRLEVVERLLPASVHGGPVVRRLPAGQPVRRVVELRRVGGAWRVGRVLTP